MRKLLVAFLLSPLVIACGGDDDGSTGPTPFYEDLVGAFLGVVGGIPEGWTFQGDLQLFIGQNQGTLGGGYGLIGELTEGIDEFWIVNGGNLLGTITAGTNPSVNITVTSNSCPNISMSWSGTYASAEHDLILNGDFIIYDYETCTTLLSFPSTVVYHR